MKNIYLILSFFLLFCISCVDTQEKTNKEVTNSQIGKNKIFKEIFLFDINQTGSNTTLDKFKYQDRKRNLGDSSKKAINEFNDKLLRDVNKKYSDFLDSFNINIQSGNPILVQKALKEGGDIILEFLFSDSTVIPNKVYLNKNKMTADDLKTIEQLYKTTDYREALKIIEIGRKNGLFQRSFKFSNGRGVGIESMTFPNEKTMETYVIKNLVYENKYVIVNENVAIALNVALNVQVVVNSHVAWNSGIQGFPEKNLLQEKIVRELTLKYKK